MKGQKCLAVLGPAIRFNLFWQHESIFVASAAKKYFHCCQFKNNVSAPCKPQKWKANFAI